MATKYLQDADIKTITEALAAVEEHSKDLPPEIAEIKRRYLTDKERGGELTPVLMAIIKALSAPRTVAGPTHGGNGKKTAKAEQTVATPSMVAGRKQEPTEIPTVRPDANVPPNPAATPIESGERQQGIPIGENRTKKM